MKRHLAHALRRTARKLIGWSNRLDRPFVNVHIGREMYAAGAAFDKAGERMAASTAKVVNAEERLAQARRRAQRDIGFRG